MARAQTQRLARRPMALGALLVILASQISISLMAVDFQISVAVVLLPTLAFLSPNLPPLPVAALAAPGVFLLRSAMQWFSTGSLSGCWQAHAPELLFYFTYGALLSAYLRRVPLHPFQAAKCVPLIAIDAGANFVELLVRLGEGVFSPAIVLQLLAVGLGRSALAWAAIRMLDYYGFQVLHKEDAQRYQRLLLMTAALKSEVAWMDKGTALIERTMNSAYHLYSQLRAAGGDPGITDTALTIAKDIHEVKKEYFLIMRGISEALDAERGQGGMELGELLRIMGQSVERTAKAAGKEIRLTCRCETALRTTQHHYLMSILRNLLNNAVEAAGTGAPAHLTLTARAEGEALSLLVSDDCGGIPPQRLGQIFAPGFSSKINYATGEINRGLGLTIVKELVEDKLGGELAVTSADGGTVFTITLPRERLEDRQDAVLPG